MINKIIKLFSRIQKHFVLLSIISLFGGLILMLATQSKNIKFKQGELDFSNQHITINVDIATSQSQLEKGLMYRDQLDNTQGMLLIFKKEKRARIWMKNMLIPLDIIYISAQNRVISLLKNIPPCLRNNCTIYEPRILSKMVLELNVGKIDEYKIKMGDKVTLSVFEN